MVGSGTIISDETLKQRCNAVWRVLSKKETESVKECDFFNAPCASKISHLFGMVPEEEFAS